MRKKLVKLILFSFLSLIFLIASAVFLITSNFGLTNIVAPFVGYLIDSGFYVDRASFSLTDLRLKAYGVRVGEIHCPMVVGDAEVTFNIPNLFKNKLSFADIHVLQADLNFIENEKGVWNIPWLYTPDSGSSSSDAIQLDFSKFHIDKLRIIYNKERHLSGGKFRIEANLNDVTGDSFRNREFSSMRYTGTVSIASEGRVDLKNSNISGTFGVNLDKDYGLSSIRFETVFIGMNGTIIGSPFMNDKFHITADAETGRDGVLNIKEFNAVSFQNDIRESSIGITGKYKETPEILDLNVKASHIKPYLSKFIAQLFGNINPGDTEFDFSGRFYYTPADAAFTGELEASNFSLNSQYYKFTNTVPLSLSLAYEIGYKPPEETISFKKLNLNLYQTDKKIISLKLNNTFMMEWGDNPVPVEDSSPEISLNIKGMDMCFFNNFLPSDTHLSSGSLDANLAFSLKDKCNNLHITGDVKTNNVLMTIGTAVIGGFSANNQVDLDIAQFKYYKLNNLILNLHNSTASIGDLSINGNYDSVTGAGKGVISLAEAGCDFTEIFKNLTPEENTAIRKFNQVFAPFSLSGTASLSLQAGLKKDMYLDLNSTTLCLKSRHGGGVTVSIADPINLEIRDSDAVLKNMPEINIELKEQDVCRYNHYIPDSWDFKFTRGQFDSKFKFSSDPRLESAMLSGTVILNSPSFVFNGKDHKRVRRAGLEGKIRISSQSGNDSPISIKSDISGIRLLILNSMQKEFPVNGTANTDITIERNKTSIKTVHLDINLPEGKLANLDISGFVDGVHERRTADLKVSSEGIDLEKTISSITFFMPEDTDTDTCAEPDSMDFDGMKANLELNLKNIRYGELLTGGIDGHLTLDRGKFTFDPCMIDINGDRIATKLYLNTAVSDGYEYKGGIDLISGFKLAPVIKTFVPGSYSNVSGNIRSLQLYASGKGITDKDLVNNLTGSLRAETNDLSLPANIQHYRLFRTMLIPIQIMSKIQQFMPGGLLPGNLIQAALATQSVFSYTNNIYLRNGIISIEKQPGMIYFQKVYFTGNQNDFIREMLFTGTIDGEGNMNLTTNSDISGLTVPVNIYGTLDNPSPDTTKFMSDFFRLNALNLCDPSNIKGIVKSTATGVERTVSGTVSFVGGLLTNPVQEIQSLGNMFSPPSQEKK